MLQGQNLSEILVDMDGVIADFEQAVLSRFQIQYPQKRFIEKKDRKEFYIDHDYIALGSSHLVKDIIETKGFYASLPLINGAKVALTEMEKKGYEVFLLSSPLQNYRHCVLEKYEWVKRNLGPAWTKKIILAREKTVVMGDILIDDRPNIVGADKASWKHVYFNQPYNAGYNKPRIKNWKDWESVVNKVLLEQQAVSSAQLGSDQGQEAEYQRGRCQCTHQ